MSDFIKTLAIILLTAITFSLAFNVVYASHTCQAIDPNGCYNKNNVLTSDIAPDQFGFYRVEDRCTVSKEGKTHNCICPSSSSPTPVEETEPDKLQEACGCVYGTDWNGISKCCGDDTDDCGTISPSGILCNVDQAGKAKWIVPSENKGGITYVGCSDTEYLSDGLKLIECDGTFWKTPVTIGANTHEYMCIGSGMDSIVECCGDGFCNSNIGGQRLVTGESTDYTNPQDSSSIPTGSVVFPITGNAMFSITGAAVTDISDPNLVVYWKFDESNGTTASDSSGHGNDASLINPNALKDSNGNVIGYSSWTTGHLGSGLSLSSPANNDRLVKTPVANFPTDEITTAYWVKTKDKTGGFISYASSKSYKDWGIYNYQGNILIYRGLKVINTRKKIFDNKWHFIAVTWRGSDGTTSLYIDGSLNYSTTLAKGTSIAQKGSLVLGNWQTKINGGYTTGRDLNAVMDEVRVYNRVLSADEIKSLYEDTGIPAKPELTITTPSLPWGKLGDPYSEEIAASGGNGRYSWALDSGSLPMGIAMENGSCTGEMGCHTQLSGTPTATGTYSFAVSVNDGINRTSKSFTIVITTSTTTTFYCTPDGKFIADLDVPNSQVKNLPLIDRNRATCEGAGFTWTGTKCCSENDDEDEFYNDPNGTGGCWGSDPVVSPDFAGDTDSSVINYNGEFHGCEIGKSNFNKNNEFVLSLADQHTSRGLVTNNNYCFSDPSNRYYCSYTEKWLLTNSMDKTHFSVSPLSAAQNTTQFAECCSPTQCWNGTVCIGNQIANPSSPPTNGFRCIDGEWSQAEMKDCPDGRPCGFCPIQSQCISDLPAGTLPHCVGANTYTNDNFCDNGTWTTRTRLVALNLLKIKGSITNSDYTLFCDNKENTLNKLQYLTSTNDAVLTIITDLNANNFCVLQAADRIVIGASLNKDFESVLPKTFNLFGIRNCNSGLANDNKYHSCDATSKVWNNKGLKSIIFSPAAIPFPSQEEPFDLTFSKEFIDFIKNPIKSIIEAIKNMIQEPPVDNSYLKGVKKFEKLYMAQQGTKSIMGSVEGKSFKNMVIQYAGFDDNICSLVESYSQAKTNSFSGMVCRKQENIYYILAQGTQFTNLNPDAIWADMTSKLRLK